MYWLLLFQEEITFLHCNTVVSRCQLIIRQVLPFPLKGGDSSYTYLSTIRLISTGRKFEIALTRFSELFQIHTYEQKIRED